MADRRPRGPCMFRERDVAKALKIVKAAGGGRVEVDRDGKIAIIPLQGTPETAQEGNEWDEVLS